jgi:protein TonB
MFETSLLPERRGKDVRAVRCIAIGSITFEAVAVAAFVLVPLLWPDTLPALTHAPKLTSVTLRRPPIKIVQPTPRIVRISNASAISAPTQSASPMMEARHGGMLTQAPSSASQNEPPLLALGGGMGKPGVLGVGFSTSGSSGPAVVSSTAPPKSGAALRISQGVSTGLLLAPMHPQYPGIAVIARIEGTVIVTATIDRTGKIVGVRVLSGPDMLRSAAAEAVREARYRPYLLNGEPTEVVTTVSVKFRMNG